MQADVEQRVRSEGNSGVAEVRSTNSAVHTYHQSDYITSAAINIHDHANNDRTVGMGEFSGVLNGVQFSTRHNDYKLVQPVAESGPAFYHKTRQIPFPDVPPEVTGSVENQVEEMQKYFKAWQNQNTDERDYRPYFKANLCYLEGSWISSTQGEIEDWDSDRHFIDAKNWVQLNERTRFFLNSGGKNNNENLPWLPTALRDYKISENGDILVEEANFHVRILCHPLKDDLPLNRLRMETRLSTRLLRYPLTEEQVLNSRRAVFEVNTKDEDKWYDRQATRQFLDDLMEQIPGKDNYNGDLRDTISGQSAIPFDATMSNKDLNSAYYSRFFSLDKTDAMGRSNRRRGFNDVTFWAAQTSQTKVSPLSFEEDETTVVQRWSYAIPLEIVYTTPLSKWNPYNLKLGDRDSKPGKNGRNGGFTKETAYDGINFKTYFQTPAEFYETSTDSQSDAADTSKGVVGVLDQNGEVRRVVAAGTRCFFPKIKGIEHKVRQRYPIPPIHFSKDASFRDLSAFLEVNKEGLTNSKPEEMGFDMFLNYESSHGHRISVSGEQAMRLDAGETVMIESEKNYDHTHTVWVKWDAEKSDIIILGCDELGQLVCKGGHYKISDSYTLYLSPGNGGHIHAIYVGKERQQKLAAGQEVEIRSTESEDHQHAIVITRGVEQNERKEYVHTIKMCDGLFGTCGDGHTKLCYQKTCVAPVPPPFPYAVLSLAEGISGHTHQIELEKWQSDELWSGNAGRTIYVNTLESRGHSHRLKLQRINADGWKYVAIVCDGKKFCQDGHPQVLIDHYRLWLSYGLNGHDHSLTFYSGEIRTFGRGEIVTRGTSNDNDHRHTLEIARGNTPTLVDGTHRYVHTIQNCDDNPDICVDGHASLCYDRNCGNYVDPDDFGYIIYLKGSQGHKHEIRISAEEARQLANREEITVQTEPGQVSGQTDAHVHVITLVSWVNPEKSWEVFFRMTSCDGEPFRCPDLHASLVTYYSLYLVNPLGGHQHQIYLGPREQQILASGRKLKERSGSAAGHRHTVFISRSPEKNQLGQYTHTIYDCDDNLDECADGHKSLCYDSQCKPASPQAEVYFSLMLQSSDPDMHTHRVDLLKWQSEWLNNGHQLSVITEESGFHHRHLLLVSKVEGTYVIEKCSGQDDKCPDGHDKLSNHFKLWLHPGEEDHDHYLNIYTGHDINFGSGIEEKPLPSIGTNSARIGSASSHKHQVVVSRSLTRNANLLYDYTIVSCDGVDGPCPDNGSTELCYVRGCEAFDLDPSPKPPAPLSPAPNPVVIPEALPPVPEPILPQVIEVDEVDECFEGGDNCSTNAICTNIVDFDNVAFDCTCLAGFTGDGVTCLGEEPEPVWTPWGPCIEGNLCWQEGKQYRTCITESSIPDCSGANEKSCTPGPCTSWGPWSSCLGACGTSGKQERTCLDSGRQCKGQKSCQNDPCPGIWSDWSDCQGDCGSDGLRTRTCTTSQLPCIGDSSEVCTVPACAGNWGDWSACEGGLCGEQGTRDRVCSIAGQCAGESSGDCSMPDCQSSCLVVLASPFPYTYLFADIDSQEDCFDACTGQESTDREPANIDTPYAAMNGGSFCYCISQEEFDNANFAVADQDECDEPCLDEPTKFCGGDVDMYFQFVKGLGSQVGSSKVGENGDDNDDNDDSNLGRINNYSDDNDDHHHSGLSNAEIAGIVLACIGGVLLFAVVLLLILRK